MTKGKTKARLRQDLGKARQSKEKGQVRESKVKCGKVRQEKGL